MCDEKAYVESNPFCLFEYSWKVPMTVAWGMSDKHLPKSEAENFVKRNPSVLKAAMLDGAGHLPQEDWYC
jgi:pimeloyl-ACP methyl ester carboxylesterase